MGTFMVAEPLFLEKKWAGKRLASIFPKAPKNTGEAWMFSGIPGKETTLVDCYGSESLPSASISRLTGKRFPRIPFLVKLINASQWLSVQVHPGDSMSSTQEGEPWGKNELWYVLEAGKEAKILYGLKDCPDRGQLQSILADKKLKDHVKSVSISKGNLVDIPAGTVHALGPDSMILEIQQASDVTYRLFDWDREQPDRPLHTEKALDAIEFGRETSSPIQLQRQFKNPLFDISLHDGRKTRVRGFSLVFSLETILLEGYEMKPLFCALVPFNTSVELSGACMIIRLGKAWNSLQEKKNESHASGQKNNNQNTE